MKRSSSGGGESASAARKRQATSAQDPLDEDPLRPSSSTQEYDDAASVASMGNLILALVLPYVQHRATWNNVCCASKELTLAGKKMRPPWLNAILNVGAAGAVTAIAVSPCESYLACSIVAQSVVRVWDRHGQHTRLEGNTDRITCLQYSFDGKYLASGNYDSSIRLWRTTASDPAASHSSDESRDQGMNSRATSGNRRYYSDWTQVRNYCFGFFTDRLEYLGIGMRGWRDQVVECE
jgi:hypothetical protein